MDLKKKKVAIYLSGGGARGGYQVGVLHGLCKMLAEHKIDNPLIIFGSSAGAISGSYLAANSHIPDFHIDRLVDVWENLDANDVYKTHPMSLAWQGLKMFSTISLGKFSKDERVLSLLNHKPLFNLIDKSMNTNHIYRNIDKGHLYGFAINLLNYGNGLNTSYYYSHDEIPEWSRRFERNLNQKITSRHIWASSSIPILFPPVKIGKQYYGDGGFRHHSPLNTVINMGAESIIVIGVKNSEFINEDAQDFPSLAHISGMIMNSMMNDGLEKDIERVMHSNDYVANNNKLRPISIESIHPSKDLEIEVLKHTKHIPKTFHHLLRGLGDDDGAGLLISYLLFHEAWMKEQSELGKADFEKQKDRILKLF